MDVNTIRVAVAEPQMLFRDALAFLLNSAPDLTVTAAANTPGELGQALDKTVADVILLGLEAHPDGWRHALQDLPSLATRWRTLVLTVSSDPTIHARVIELGAHGILGKEQGAEILIKAIRKVHAGELWLDRARTAGVLRRLTRGHSAEDPERVRIQSLTRREREIVALVAEGMKNRQIAGRLNISEATARNHLTSILDKLELSDRFQLAVYSYRRGLVELPQPLALLEGAFGDR